MHPTRHGRDQILTRPRRALSVLLNAAELLLPSVGYWGLEMVKLSVKVFRWYPRAV